VRTYQNTPTQSIDNNINKLRTNQLHEVCNDVWDEYYGIKTHGLHISTASGVH
jgi:hypothetical protein